MPFPYEFPFDFDIWLVNIIILESPLNQDMADLSSVICQRCSLNSGINVLIKLPGEL